MMVRLCIAFACISATACSFSGGGTNAVDSDAAALPDAPTGPCEPSEAASCVVGTTLRQCAEDGSGYVDTDCPLGCLEEGDAHCGSFTPSNAVVFGASEAVTTLDDPQVVVFSETGQINVGGATLRAAGEGIDAATQIVFSIITQTDAPDIGVFEFSSLTIASETVVRVRGTSAVAFVARGPIEIAGFIDVSSAIEQCNAADATCPGPGGGAGGAVATDGNSVIGDMGVGGAGDMGDATMGGESGGGGGGFLTMGGASGTPLGSMPATGGAAWAPAELSPLVGGAGGGGGGIELEDVSGICGGTLPPYDGGVGGGGGGAIQLVSATRVLFNAPVGRCGVDAGGGGGAPGACSASGGGGGAGGAVLIEAPEIKTSVGCFIVANGGGGGASDNSLLDAPGEDGTRSTVAAAGGGAGNNQGGAGASRMADAQSSLDNDNESAGGGGGGGHIVLRALSTGIVTSGPVSPVESKRALLVF